MKIFVSYATVDLERFEIAKIAGLLEQKPEFERVYYWDRDSTSQKSIVAYMEESISDSDVILIICSEASNKSGPVQQETDMAVYLNKRIVPIFEEITDVRLSLRPKRGVSFRKDDFDKFLNELILVLTESLPPHQIEEQIAEFHGIPLVLKEYKAMKKLEDQLNKIIPPISPTSITISEGGTKRKTKYQGEPFGFHGESNHVLEFIYIGTEDDFLSFIPESIGELTHLEILIISNHNISILPEFIGKLSRLKHFDILNNKLKKFPASFKNLESLEELRFAGNEITSNIKGIGNSLISSMNYEILSAVLERGCKLDRNYCKRVALSFYSNEYRYSDFFCFNCGLKNNNVGTKLSEGLYMCSQCGNETGYVFFLERNKEREIKQNKN